MKDLLRSLAPISDEAWKEIEEEASETLKTTLAGRKLADFTGPLGWDVSSVDTGDTRKLEKAPQPGVTAQLRQPKPLVEFRIPFSLSREELLKIGRGARDADLDPVREAAYTIALAEDKAIFHGFGEGQITGICEAAADRTLSITEDYEDYPGVVAQAVSELHGSGVAGPYAIALGPRCYTGLTRTAQGGYPVIEHVRRILDGPIVPARGLDGACVISLRGGDFEIVVGRDFSIGYTHHDATAVELYLEESFTFLPLGPEAAVPLRYNK